MMERAYGLITEIHCKSAGSALRGKVATSVSHLQFASDPIQLCPDASRHCGATFVGRDEVLTNDQLMCSKKEQAVSVLTSRFANCATHSQPDGANRH